PMRCSPPPRGTTPSSSRSFVASSTTRAPSSSARRGGCDRSSLDRPPMAVFTPSFDFTTRTHDQIVDVTPEVERIVAQSGARDGIVCVFTPHATAAITINENDDPNIGVDLVAALRKAVADHDGWLHDRVDDNAASHIKSAIVGPSQSIPLIDGR